MRLKDLWKFKFFWNDVENAKNDTNISKMYFFWVFVVFCYFYFLKFFYQNMGQKLGSNICPLFTMLTKQNIINVLHSKLVMKGKKMISLSWATCKKIGLFSRATCPHSHWSIFMGDLPIHTHFGLFSRATGPHIFTRVYFQGRPAYAHLPWSIFMGNL
jgi:hypothetical protein